MTANNSVYVALGLDRDKKPRAARIPHQDLQVAIKAAGTMGLRVGHTGTPEGIKLAKSLPEVRLFNTGKGLVPLAKKAVYEALEKALTILDPPAEPKPPAQVRSAVPPGPTNPAGAAQSAQPAPSPAASSNASPWAAIKVGATVLWTVDPAEGWFACTVVGASKDGRKLNLKWRDFKGFKPFEVDRMAVGLVASTR